MAPETVSVRTDDRCGLRAGRGRQIRYAEAFELSQYGRQAKVDELLQMFPK